MAWTYSTTRLYLRDSYNNPVASYVPTDPNNPSPPVGAGNFQSLEWTLVTNEVGHLKVEILGYLDDTKIGEYFRIDLYRILRDDYGHDSPFRVGDTQWLVYDWEWVRGKDGVKKTVVMARPAIWLCQARVVAYTDNYNVSSSETYLNVPMDDICKKVITTNFISPTNTLISSLDAQANLQLGRSWSAYLQVAPLLSQAPTQKKQTAWLDTKPLLDDLCRSSEAAGTPLFYDIVVGTGSSGQGILEFRTYVNQRGVDRTQASQFPLWFSDANNDLTESHDESNHGDAKSFVYALGIGTGPARVANIAYDANVINNSAFGRWEQAVVEKKGLTAAELLPVANKALRKARPVKSGMGIILNKSGKQFQVDWGHGDRCMLAIRKHEYIVRLDTVNGRVFPTGAEEITATLRHESNVQ